MSIFRLFLVSMFLLVLIEEVEAQQAIVPYVKESRVVLDGVVRLGEYGGSFLDPATGMSVNWEHNGTVLKVGLVMRCLGWLSLGIGSQGTRMDGSNMIIGYVDKSGVTSVVDEVGVGRQHYPDTQKGGKNDILAYAGGQAAGNITIEFEIPLVSGDPLDIPLLGNHTYGFFLGYQASARDTSTYHTAHSPTYDVFVEVPPTAPAPSPAQTPFLWEEALGALAVVIAALVVVRYLRRPRVIRFKLPTPTSTAFNSSAMVADP